MPPDLMLHLNYFIQNDLKTLKRVMRTKARKNVKIVQSGIMWAIEYKNCEALKILLTSPLPDFYGDINHFLHRAVMSSDVKVLQILLADHRFDVNRFSDPDDKFDEVTPLMVACSMGKYEMVKKLLDNPKVDVNAISTIDGRTVLEHTNFNLDIEELLLNHRDISHLLIQDLLLRKLSYISNIYSDNLNDSEDPEDNSINPGINLITLELNEHINLFLKKSFENGFRLKSFFDKKYEFHEHFQCWIREALEMKIREEYYMGNINVSEESLGNKAFGICIDSLQASILKCKCVQCLDIKKRRQLMYAIHSDSNFHHQLLKEKGTTDKCKIKKNNSAKKSGVKCLVDTKLTVLHKSRSFEVRCDFLYSPLPGIFEHLLLNGGDEKGLEGIINGTISIVELDEEYKNKSISKKGNKKHITDVKRNENFGDSSSSITEKSAVCVDFDTLCWTCSDTQVKLYKCGGCRKARYCSDGCIANDWANHMNYCNKKQEKRNLKKLTSSE